MSWPHKPKSGLAKLSSLPGLKKLPKEYSDQNLNAPLPLKNTTNMSPARLSTPAAMAAPKAPSIPSQEELSPRAARFRRLAGILGPKK